MKTKRNYNRNKNMNYDRWTPIKNTCYPYRVFKQYNTELRRINMSFTAAKKYTYKNLKETDNANWDDKASSYLYTNDNEELTIKQWSNTFNLFENWVILNKLMALSSYFEIYLSSIIRLALESDPGVYIGQPHSVDGAVLLKKGIEPFTKKEIESHIIGCTKGDWQCRQKYYKRLFGNIPTSFKQGLSDLERMRILRNEIGHAFGRDIEKSRDYTITKISDMHILSSSNFIKYQELIEQCSLDINEQLMNSHIGIYQELCYFHHLQEELRSTDSQSRAHSFKKKYGIETQDPYSKEFCSWMVKYYDNL